LLQRPHTISDFRMRRLTIFASLFAAMLGLLGFFSYYFYRASLL
jgi:hypothetical protein